ncbi:MAG: hypothetical protein M3Y71_07760 [Actinomycetota bacterium]|nr:hypothetical protein [Actinomycetota bacterium]
MPDKDVDEQFAAIMAHWHEDALGLDPFGDPRGPDSDAAGAPDGTNVTEASTDGSAATRAVEGAETSVPDQSLEVADEPPPRSPVNPPPPMPPMTPGPAMTPGRASGLSWRQHVPDPEPEEHFVPPPPAPLPSADDKHFWLMMVGLIGGPLLFVYLILFNRDGNGWWMVCGIGMTVAGFVLLVLRQPLHRDEDDDGVRL